MVNQTGISDLPGELYQLKGNEPILLDNPQTIWVVQSGSIALFAVTIRNGIVEGTRRYLFNINPKEALFGTTPSPSDYNYQMLAVPTEKTELLQVDWECFIESIAEADIRTVALVEGWLQKLSTALPLSDIMWLEADAALQFTTKTKNAFRDSDKLFAGLSQLHQRFFKYITLWEEQEHVEELQRLQARKDLDRQVTAEALEELASPLMPKETKFFPEGTPLLVAAGAVGKALNVKIIPPAQSEDPKSVKEPLETIAQASRLRMRRVLLQDNWWKQDCGPMIAYTQQDERPVALLPISASSYELFDPVAQTRIFVNASIASSLAPVAYTFYRSLPNKVLNVFDVLWFAFSGRGKDLLVILLTGIAVTLLGMLTPHATAILIDHAIPDNDRGLLLQFGLGLLVAGGATALFRLAQGLSLLRVETVSDVSTQAAVWDRLLNLPVSFFRQYTTGDLHSRVTSVSSIRRQLSGNTLMNIISGLFAFLNLALLFYYNVKLALIAVAVALVEIAVTTISGIILVRQIRPLLEIQGNLFGQTVQLINGISKLRVAGAEERAFAFWSKNYSRQIKLELSTQFIEDAVTLFNTVMPTITSGVLFWFTTQLLTEVQTTGQTALTLGTFLAFNTAFITFVDGATNASNTVSDVLQVIPLWKRAQPIVKTTPEVDFTKADPGKLTGRITVDRVSFRYREDGPITLENVSIHAERGEFIALVGESGSGKSTIFRLLLGFETPQDGSIYYDKKDLSGLDVSAVRRQLGVVLQNGNIISGSIFDNLGGNAQIIQNEAWEAARMSGLADDIAAMPMGMHTVVSEGGGNLSGGQRQRLLIAKALVLKPQILLFDEATSALDNRTQAIVSENLDRLQVTRIVIAHRISTIRNAHRIYVLQAGRVVQQGSFEDLASQEGFFAQLMARQMA